MRFFIKATGDVCYDRRGVTFPYRGGEYLSEEYVRVMGGENVAWENQYGWDNQPEVLCFDGSQHTARQVEVMLPRGLLVSAHWKEG